MMVYRQNRRSFESVKRADAAVKSMHDFTSPEVLYRELINSVLKYHPSTDISYDRKRLIRFASDAHKDQKRKVWGTLYYPSVMCGDYPGGSGAG